MNPTEKVLSEKIELKQRMNIKIENNRLNQIREVVNRKYYYFQLVALHCGTVEGRLKSRNLASIGL